MTDPSLKTSPVPLPLGSLEDLDFVLGKHQFVSMITVAKAKVTPIHELTIPRSELSSLVLCKRLQHKVVLAQVAKTATVATLGDSTCIISGLESTVTTLNPFMHARYGEVHEINKRIASKCFLEEASHVESEQNIADLATRMDGSLAAIGPNSLWQCGPTCLREPRYK